MSYYFDHQEELDQEIRREWDQAQQQRQAATRSPFYLRMHSKGLP
jgi:hypothetical protein